MKERGAVGKRGVRRFFSGEREEGSEEEEESEERSPIMNEQEDSHRFKERNKGNRGGEGTRIYFREPKPWMMVKKKL
jgi:hypothetical protein